MLSLLFILVGVGLLAAALYIFLAQEEDQRKKAGIISAAGAVSLLIGGILYVYILKQMPTAFAPLPPPSLKPVEEPVDNTPYIPPAIVVPSGSVVASGSARDRSPVALSLEGRGYTNIDENEVVIFPPVPPNADYEEEPQEDTYTMKDMVKIANHLNFMDDKFSGQLARDETDWNKENYYPMQEWAKLVFDFENYSIRLRSMAQERRGRGTGPVRRDLFILSKKYRLMVNIYALHIRTGNPLDRKQLEQTQTEIDRLRRRLAYYDPTAGTYVP